MSTIIGGREMKSAEQFIKSVEHLAGQYGLTFNKESLQEPAAKRLSYFPLLLEKLLPGAAYGHLLEQGKSPSSYYPDLFDGYLDTTAGEFDPQELDFDSDDDWESMLIRFARAGIEHELRVDDVNDSDWFSADFVEALNRFAEKHLTGRWVAFYDQCDWCTSVYVPAAAYEAFKRLSNDLESRLEPQ